MWRLKPGNSGDESRRAAKQRWSRETRVNEKKTGSIADNDQTG
jgi:hypothetical protein